MSAVPAAPLSTRRSPHWLDVVADPVRLQIVRSLSQVPDSTASELATRNKASYQTLRRHLDALQASGVIQARPGKSDGETSGRPATRFSLAPGIRESINSVLDGTP